MPKAMMTLPTGRINNAGFTLTGILVALTILGISLVLIVSSLSNLTRFLSETEAQIQAATLSTAKILEWSENLRHGGNPNVGSEGEKFKGNSDFSWKAAITPQASDSALYDLDLTIFYRDQTDPMLQFISQGWQRELKKESDEDETATS